MTEWAQWRDRDAAEHYWLAADFGAPGLAPAVTVELLRGLQRRDRLSELGEVLQHRTVPSNVFTPGRLLSATASLLARPGIDRRHALREVKEVVLTDVRRQKLNRKPEFVPLADHREAGATEVSEEVAG